MRQSPSGTDFLFIYFYDIDSRAADVLRLFRALLARGVDRFLDLMFISYARVMPPLPTYAYAAAARSPHTCGERRPSTDDDMHRRCAGG